MSARERLLQEIDLLGYEAYDAPRFADFDSWEAAIDAIEAEAVAGIAEAVRKLPEPTLGMKGGVNREAVIAIVRGAVAR